MYYGARYYDAALERFISADTIVSSAGNPQSLNRYSYVLNNPVRLVDPSGHCPDEGSCISPAREYRSIVRELGFEPPWLQVASESDWDEIAKWPTAGVKFTANISGDSQPLNWTYGNMMTVIDGLNTGSSFIGGSISGFGLSNGGTLTFNSLQAGCATCIGGNYDSGTNTIQLFLWASSPSGDPRTLESVVHELGHSVDHHIGAVDYWSANDQRWLRAGAWSKFYTAGHTTWLSDDQTGAATSYALQNPVEDFAETFTVMALGHPREFSPFGLARGQSGEPSPARLNALRVALGYIQ